MAAEQSLGPAATSLKEGEGYGWTSYSVPAGKVPWNSVLSTGGVITTVTIMRMQVYNVRITRPTIPPDQVCPWTRPNQ